MRQEEVVFIHTLIRGAMSGQDAERQEMTALANVFAKKGYCFLDTAAGKQKQQGKGTKQKQKASGKKKQRTK